MSKDALPRAIKRIQNRVGIPEWTAHDLRRTFATQLGESLNIDPVVIENVLVIKCLELWLLIIKMRCYPNVKKHWTPGQAILQD